MSTTTFQWDAIQWLREEAGLATDVRPADRVEDPDAPLLIEGFLVRPSRAGAYAYAALWVLTLAILLAMLGMPGISAATEVLLNRAGDVGFVVAAGLLLAAWIISRRNRSPALVQLHPIAAPVTVDAVGTLHQRAHGAATWLVSEQAPAPEVLAAATKLGVRCFARTARGAFVALADQGSSRNSSTTG
jgi:hypothetical protein